MQPFEFLTPTTLHDACLALQREDAMLVAGGTTVVDLMRSGVLAPRYLVDISRVGGLRSVETEGPVLRFGALVPMADMAENQMLLRSYPALAQSLQQAASQQLRNVATLAGNLLQRTRCAYYRDGASPCNKRVPGSGCAALAGYNRDHAVLGGSDACVATYPGDWAVALVAFAAELELFSLSGMRVVPLDGFFREPGTTPQIETVLHSGEVIAAIRVPATQLGRHSAYVKVRDRRSYAFAVASAAVALLIDGDRVRDARIALGGVATRPWRSRDAERALIGQVLTTDAADAAGRAAFRHARALRDNGVKLRLGPATVAASILAAQRARPT